MRLLLDQNVSYRLIKKIEHQFPGSEHVKKLKLLDKSDLEIWKFARENNYSLLTFDSDLIPFMVHLQKLFYSEQLIKQHTILKGLLQKNLI